VAIDRKAKLNTIAKPVPKLEDKKTENKKITKAVSLTNNAPAAKNKPDNDDN
jgi:hypothetical protein